MKQQLVPEVATNWLDQLEKSLILAKEIEFDTSHSGRLHRVEGNIYTAGFDSLSAPVKSFSRRGTKYTSKNSLNSCTKVVLLVPGRPIISDCLCRRWRPLHKL